MAFGEYLKRILATALLLVLLYTLWVHPFHSSTRLCIGRDCHRHRAAHALPAEKRDEARPGAHPGDPLQLHLNHPAFALDCSNPWKRGGRYRERCARRGRKVPNKPMSNSGTTPPAIQSILPGIPTANAQEPIDAASLKNLFNWFGKVGNGHCARSARRHRAHCRNPSQSRAGAVHLHLFPARTAKLHHRRAPISFQPASINGLKKFSAPSAPR